MPLTLVHHPAAILRHTATPIAVVDDAVRALAEAMAEAMYLAPGIGLAANQIGDPRALAVIDLEEGRGLRTLINPRIVAAEGRVFSREGCLSIPGKRFKLPRAERVTVEALDERGRPVRIEGEGLLAFALQHEIDHLEGRLILDRAREK